MDYELTAALGFLQSCARHRTDLLMNSWRMNRDAIERGRTEPPYAFVAPPASNDAWTLNRLLAPLLAAGVEVHRATAPFTADGVAYPAQTDVILMAQPLRPYAKDLLEAQEYPDRRLYPSGPPEPPYDEAGWTLPLKMGLDVVEVEKPFEAKLERVASVAASRGQVVGVRGEAIGFAPGSNATTILVNRLLAAGADVIWTDESLRESGVALPAHSFVVHADAKGSAAVARALVDLPVTGHLLPAVPRGRRLAVPRIGLYQPWGGNADEGWTRWVFDQYRIPFTTITDRDVRAGTLHPYTHHWLLEMIGKHALGIAPDVQPRWV